MPRKTDFKTMSKIELAAAQGVSTQTLDQWLNRGMPYVAKPGEGSRTYQLDPSAVLRWRLDYERAPAEAVTDATDLNEAKPRKAVAEARPAKMAADREAGRLLAREDVDQAVIGAFSRVRPRLALGCGLGRHLGRQRQEPRPLPPSGQPVAPHRAGLSRCSTSGGFAGFAEVATGRLDRPGGVLPAVSVSSGGERGAVWAGAGDTERPGYQREKGGYSGG